MARLRNIRGICQVSLSTSDIVRNPLVHKIVQAYEEGGPQAALGRGTSMSNGKQQAAAR